MILIDTSGLLSAMFADQRHHEVCARILREAEPPRIISPYVIAEADYLIQKYAGIDAELLFLEELSRGAYVVATFGLLEISKSKDIVAKYRDLGIGVTDASIVVDAEIYDCYDVLTLDLRHFRALRVPGSRRPFRILPADL
ncbi:MAG TPA: PIN domain-containing protein [Thermoanaerobaculia bacterium]|nr:PIN domain-containing protein [Thermoanaerobaculia bacterium]